MLPCIVYEDEHLLVVNKPAGLNTHSPSPYAGEGIYEWLRHREPRWNSLAIIHRLDKHTSGLLVFGLSPLANHSLTDQFAGKDVRKTYLLLTDHLQTAVPPHCRSTIFKIGSSFVSRPWAEGAELAETEFQEVDRQVAGQILRAPLSNHLRLLEARPSTGRTHQIRLHASTSEFPVLGDILYGGTPAARLYLHAWKLRLAHPQTGEALEFEVPPPFQTAGPISHPGGLARVAADLRANIINATETAAFRLVHGASDGLPGFYADAVGPYLLVQSAGVLSATEKEAVDSLQQAGAFNGVYHKTLTRHTRGKGTEISPQHLSGEAASERWTILENGVSYELSFGEGYSIGLFLDQRDNRRRLITGHVADGFPLYENPGASPPEVLNTFAYTCAFSVAAARGGARATSLDLSKKYLDWGRRNFELNGIDPARHDYIYGDVFEWLKRLGRKGRLYDVVILDPPTFSQSKERGVFRVQKDYGELVKSALGVLKKRGVLLASTNAAEWDAERFVADVEAAIRQAGRTLVRKHYVPQPLDFPVTREEPAYLKTLWCRCG